jgi:hypothetical protein
MKNRRLTRLVIIASFVSASVALLAAKYPAQFVGKSQLTVETLAIPSISVPATHVIDWKRAAIQADTLAANTTYTFANTVDGEMERVLITNTAGNYTVTWPTVKWVAGTAPTQTVGVHTDDYTFTNVQGTIYGKATQNY